MSQIQLGEFVFARPSDWRYTNIWAVQGPAGTEIWFDESSSRPWNMLALALDEIEANRRAS